MTISFRICVTNRPSVVLVLRLSFVSVSQIECLCEQITLFKVLWRVTYFCMCLLVLGYSHWESSCTDAPNSVEIPLSHSRTSVYPQGNLLCIFLRELSINSPIPLFVKMDARHQNVAPPSSLQRWFVIVP